MNDMAKLRLLAGDTARASAAYRDAEAAYARRPYLAREKLVEAKIGLGRAYLLPGPEHAPDRARQALEAAVAMDPEDPEAQYWLGRLYLENGDGPHARDALEQLDRCGAGSCHETVVACGEVLTKEEGR